MGFRTEVIEGPAVDPITLDEAKRHARIPLDLDDDDASILLYVKAATRYVERRSGRKLVSQRLRTTFDEWPRHAGPIVLPWAAVLSIEAVSCVDDDGEPVDLDVGEWEGKPGTPGVIRRPRAIRCEAWPRGPAVVEYTAGYGDAAAVPEDAKLAVAILAASWFNRRENVVTGTIVSRVPVATVDDLIGGLRWGSYPR